MEGENQEQNRELSALISEQIEKYYQEKLDKEERRPSPGLTKARMHPEMLKQMFMLN